MLPVILREAKEEWKLCKILEKRRKTEKFHFDWPVGGGGSKMCSWKSTKTLENVVQNVCVES